MFRHIFLPFALMLVPSMIYAQIDPNKLVKVTPANNAKCVEYYTYKNEPYCSTTALSPQTIDPNIKNYEKQHIVFDDRIWRAVWGKQEANMQMVEYVPAGDDINNWKELVTSQFFAGLQNKTTATNFAQFLMKKMKDAGFNPSITIIEETPEQAMFEYQIKEPANLVQDEIVKITKGKDGLYVLHYVVKKVDMGSKQREVWIANLKRSTIKE